MDPATYPPLITVHQASEWASSLGLAMGVATVYRRIKDETIKATKPAGTGPYRISRDWFGRYLDTLATKARS